MIRAVMFDLDGTLVHSAPGVLASFRETFATEGVAAITAIDEKVIGPPLMTTLTRLTGIVDSARLDQLARTFKATYDTDGVLLADPSSGRSSTAADRRSSSRTSGSAPLVSSRSASG